MSFASVMSERQDLVNQAFAHIFSQIDFPRSAAAQQLSQSMEYSFLGGGKRFRPVLALLIAEAFAAGPQRVLSWAAAIEMIHTYSLIHDDLPCMDNDDVRRGQPTNHKVYGETTALLAGDALLSEAFRTITYGFHQDPQIAMDLVTILSEASGPSGMVGGQAIDCQAQKEKISLQELALMHKLKTGALIRATVEGAAVACGLPKVKVALVREFGELIGLAFQLKDDLLDATEKIELGSYPSLLGIEATASYLEEVSAQAKEKLSGLSIPETNPLYQLVDYNRERAN